MVYDVDNLFMEREGRKINSMRFIGNFCYLIFS